MTRILEAVLILGLVAAWRGGALDLLSRHRRFLATRLGVFLGVGAAAAFVIWLNLHQGLDGPQTVLLLATTALGYVAISVGLLDACDEAWPPTTIGSWRPPSPRGEPTARWEPRSG